MFITLPTKQASWTGVISEKIISPQPVKKFPAFYGTRRFSAIFTTARQVSPP
jgi:hypothetical protein